MPEIESMEVRLRKVSTTMIPTTHNLVTILASPPTLVNCSANFCAEAQIGNGKVKLARRCSFGDGLRASDNTMLRSLEQSTAFPTGKLKRKARGIAELHR